MTTQNDSPIIWYIPGLFSGDNPQNTALILLRKIYPNATEIKHLCWENKAEESISLEPLESIFSAFTLLDIPSLLSDLSNYTKFLTIPVDLGKKGLEIFKGRLKKSIEAAEKMAQMLSDRIANMPSSQRKKLILIGHSLGGYIIIRTLAKLHPQDLSIHSGVLLGAAIDNKDIDILSAVKATQKGIFSMVNPDDNALAGFQLATGKYALGTGCGLIRFDHTKYREIVTLKSIEHSSFFYLCQWAEANNIPIDYKKIPFQLIEEIINLLGLRDVEDN